MEDTRSVGTYGQIVPACGLWTMTGSESRAKASRWSSRRQALVGLAILVLGPVKVLYRELSATSLLSLHHQQLACQSPTLLLFISRVVTQSLLTRPPTRHGPGDFHLGLARFCRPENVKRLSPASPLYRSSVFVHPRHHHLHLHLHRQHRIAPPRQDASSASRDQHAVPHF